MLITHQYSYPMEYTMSLNVEKSPNEFVLKVPIIEKLNEYENHMEPIWFSLLRKL